MKVKNFPERKRQRQLVALAALNDKRRELSQYPHSLAYHEFGKKAREISVLEERTAINLRDVRTKKRRAVK